ncbi:tetratricopeptide repeat protein [Mucilaginibacter sp. BJC16-A38]|uniref:tetratricopeptide repeat protein n=1 Tax=Mucilaginibacter phenanthrenivorans TaxID=1234842 RepID=UPI0021571EA3|nr:tetratricopeptide repeat protein [Mucilaginibacter phenanthrenivorans]MCR8561144.1 tetratricopeptide repeat protein [Mucilaginibacter phenanthrenivorans]
MRQLIIIILFLLQGSWLFAQQEKSLVHKGNELYQQKKYTEAEATYRKSVEKKKNTEGNFNLGDALYKQKKFGEAGEQFNQLGEASTNKAVAAKAYHNLGNSLLESKKLQESIDAYKKSLINNPKDDETRYNLAYAQEKLKQQQQQDKKNNKNQDKKNQDKNKKDQDKKNQDKKDQDKKNQDQNKKDQDKQNQDKKDQKDGQQPQPNKLSKEDAERMLDALNNDEKQTQDKLKNKKLKGTKVHVEKDW